MTDIQDWTRRLIKGRIANHVVRGQEKPQTVIKAALTLLARSDMNHEELEKILEEVRAESVQPFLKPPWNQPQRLERFMIVRTDLLA